MAYKKSLKRANIVASIMMISSPVIGFVFYLPFAETAYGSLDPIRGFFLGPMIFVPLALVTYFITYLLQKKSKN